jgi:hypothetical protein
MLRVTTLHASSAAATARYYAEYLTAAPGEVPGMWAGRQADGLGLTGDVTVEQLEATLLGRELVDRQTQDGRVVRAVSGFDATFSAPKSLSVWWALTGDHRLLEAHDTAVSAAVEHLERFGSTTRIRSNGARLHPDTNGLTMATFRQTTSRADDPQIHTHAVISAFWADRLVPWSQATECSCGCDGGPAVGRTVCFPPPSELDAEGGIYVLVDDGPPEASRYAFIADAP